MSDLDLKRLDRLEQAMPRIHGHVWITQENVDYIGDNIRPLLDLVGAMGRALEGTSCSYRSPVCQKLYPKVPGRWCNRCRGLEYYREAKGE